MGIQVKQTRYVALPAGEYRARIGEVNQETGKYGPQLRVRFYLLDGEIAGQEVIGWAAATFSPRSKLYKWVQAAFGGRAIPEGYDLNTDHVLNKIVVLVLAVKTGEDGLEYNRIDDVKPISSPASTTTKTSVRVNTREPDWPPAQDREDDGIPF